MKNARLLLMMALVGVTTLSLSAAAVAQDTGTAQIYEVPGSGSGVTGSATVVPDGEDATLVTVRLEGNVDPGANYPAHLHEGTYEGGKFDFDPKPSYDLNNAVGGVSETRLEVPFEELAATDYLIAAHLPTGSGQGSGTDIAGRSYGPAIAAGPIEVGTNLPDTGGPALPSLPATALGVAAAGAVLIVGVRMATPRRGN